MIWSSIPRPSVAYAGLLTLTFGTLLWMVSERPEWRPAEGERAAETGQVLANVGQGGAATGGALLAYRALRFVRDHDTVGQAASADTLIDRGADLRPPEPRTKGDRAA